MGALIIGDEPSARSELTHLLNKIGGFEETNGAENMKETLEALPINQYDIMFLGVNSVDEGGTKSGTKAQKMKESPMTIFVTAHDQYAIQALELNAINYISRPFGQKRIEQAVDKVRATRVKDDNSASAIVNDMSTNFDQSLPVEVDGKIHMLKQQNTIGIGIHNGTTAIYTTGHKYGTTGPLSRYEK